ncbi:N-6 DNA methylase [Vibrio harveyi]|uniref:N-6 DNA methylase n=1 Tax=Vibrio harveyi TaxID=669 RepID=UPI0023808C6F|nr:N-6 DNA methylase [Vibrio harveyi]
MTLTKIIEKHANQLNLRPNQLLNKLIEGSYQYVVTGQLHNSFRSYQSAFNEFFAELFEEVMENPFRDILGETMGELNALDKKRSQHFTPIEIADFVAKVTGQNANTVSDITCGSGAMLLAAMKQHCETGEGALSIHANDLDELLCKATTVQIELNYLAMQFINPSVSVNYIVVNHDALLDYKRMHTICSDTNIVGCSDRNKITDPTIKKWLKTQLIQQDFQTAA